MRGVWTQAFGRSFPLDERLWRQNIDEDPNHDPAGVILAEEDGAVIGFVAARTCRVPIGSDGLKRGQGWINAVAVHPEHHRKGTGSKLVKAAEKWLAAQGATEITTGGSPGHFFPGVPSKPDGGVPFFESCGFQPAGEPCYDVAQDIRNYRVPTPAQRLLARSLAFRITRCGSRQVPALMDFLKQTFPGRWLYETQLRLERERSPQDIVLLMIGNRVVGFVHTYHSGSRHLGPSVHWRKLLGASYGGLGPIGIADDIRNSGLGFALLCDAVQRLKEAGVSRMAIDWTNLLKFYAGAGFKPWKEYRPFKKAP